MCCVHAEYQVSILPNGLRLWAKSKTFCQGEPLALLSKNAQQVSAADQLVTQDCVFVFSFPVSVYFCATLLLNANVCLSRICLEDFLRTSVRSVFCQCFRHPCPPLCPWVARVTRGGLEGTSAHVGLCACDGSASQCGPPTRPRDSWGPLRQLRPTAHSDSVIMGGLLLRFAVTRRRAHARARPHKSSISSGPFLRCCPTRPQQGSPALQGRGR